MKAVSVSAELTTIQRAVEAAGMLVEVDRHGGVEGEDSRPLVAAILALAACRLRDLGRAARGRLPVELFMAPHNDAVDGGDDEDLVLYAPPTSTRSKRK
jgi:hypothetical protein